MEQIHGKTKIELYNPNTKIKNVIRSENTFQGANIAKWLRSLGVCNTDMYAAGSYTGPSSKPLWQTTVGGIFLFRDTIPVGTHYMPAGNSMVGNGAFGVSNSEDVNEMGSYNSAESSADINGVTQVYDFTTNQANGQIGCVCLTSYAGGYAGYGNSGNKRRSDTIVFDRFQSADRICGHNTSQLSLNGRSGYVDNVYYEFAINTSTAKLKVTKMLVPVTKGSVFDFMPYSVDLDISSFHYSSDWFSNGSITVCYDNGYLYLLPGYAPSMGVGGVCYYWKYNPADDSIQEIQFTNPMPGRLGSPILSYAQGMLFVRMYSDTYDYPRGATLVFNSNGAHIKTIEASAHQNWEFPASNLHGGLVLMFNRTAHGDYPTGFYIYDPVADTVKPTNMSRSMNNYWNVPFTYIDDSDLCYYSESGGNPYVCNSQLYLATINNLNSLVTKTAAQTMKVTYSLTRA